MSERPWYRRFPDRFIAGTVRLTLEEKGAYSLLLDLIYARGGPIADEPRYIAGVCNCSVRKWNAIRQRLIDLGKIEAVDGFIINRRAQEEIEIASKTSEKRAESGRKGGEKSSENKAVASKNNDLVEAELKYTRASLPLEARNNTSSLRSDVVRARRAARLSEDWSLPDEWRQDAIDAGLAPDRIDAEAAKMRDWSRSSQAGAKLDWRPAWRNWCRKAAGELPRGRPPPRAPTQSDVFKLIGERAAASGQDSGDRGGVRPAILDLRPARTG